MPLQMFKCQTCGEQFKTKLAAPTHCDIPAELLIIAPTTKFLESTDKDKGKSALVGQQKLLLERARADSRDNAMDDLIQTNNDGIAMQSRWLMPDGTRRKKIDDK